MSLPLSKSEISIMLTKLVDETSQHININSSASDQVACSFELGQKLMETLISYDLDIKPQPLNFEQEERLRNELAFVNIPDGPYNSIFCFWKILIAIMLGAIFGIAIIEGLGLKAVWAIMGAGLGASLGLFLKNYLENMKNEGKIFTFLDKSFSYKTLVRIFKLALIAIIFLAIIRDFFQQNPFLQTWFDALEAFLFEGSGMALWSNMYSVVIMLIIFSLCLVQKAELNVTEFKNRLMIASVAWWTAALVYREIILEVQDNKSTEEQVILEKIVKDIYLFANELPLKQQKWLLEHLNMLHIKINRPKGQLRWSDDLALEYDALGYLEEGDACYVDSPALWKDDKLINKGTVRKIR